MALDTGGNWLVMGHACALAALVWLRISGDSHTWTEIHDEGMGTVVVDIRHFRRLIARPQCVGDPIPPQGKARARSTFTEAIQHCVRWDAASNFNVLVLKHTVEDEGIVFQRCLARS